MLVGKVVCLRAYTKDDLPKAKDFLNQVHVSRMMRTGIPFPLRLEDEEKWFASLDANSEKQYGFAIETKSAGEYVGGCGIHSIDSKNRFGILGIFLGEPHIRKGYGSDALTVLVEFAFNEINLNKVKLFVFAFNKQAIGCYKKIGFKTEGVLRQEIFRKGRYHDALVMGLLRSEWKTKGKKRQQA